MAKTWLNQMGSGAEENGVVIMYCMTLPKEMLQVMMRLNLSNRDREHCTIANVCLLTLSFKSVESNSVTRIRASEDYITASEQESRQ